MEGKHAVFILYLLDMWGNEKEGWVENNRFDLGRLYVPVDSDGSIRDTEILKAMKKKKVGLGKALNTISRKIVYVADYNGDGTWYEIGWVEDAKPVYGLKFVGEVMK